MRETRIRRPNTLKVNVLPETNGDRASWEIPLHSRLKEELKLYIHFSNRTRSRESGYRHNKD